MRRAAAIAGLVLALGAPGAQAQDWHRPWRLAQAQVVRLWQSLREVLAEAIDCGSTVPLDYAGTGARDGLFYFGRAPDSSDYYEERLRVYDRAGQACVNCGRRIKRLVQAGRSTFYCAYCQRG